MSYLLFTLDFHQLVRGKLETGCPCDIRYDPLRLAAGKEGFVQGKPDFDFTAYLQFQPQGRQEVKLQSLTGIVENAIVRNDGNGSMLAGTFTIPQDAEEIIAWFSMTDKDGNLNYDSNNGKNYHFRIYGQGVHITKADVVNSKEAGVGKFSLSALAVPAIDKITLRYRISNSKDALQEISVDMKAVSNQDQGDKNTWESGEIEVPYGAVVVYELFYFIQTNRFKIENNGSYYIAKAVDQVGIL